MRFADLEGGIWLTMEGRRFAESEVDERGQLLAWHLIAHVPLVAHVRGCSTIGLAHATCPAIGLSVSGRSAHGWRTADALIILSVPTGALTAESTCVAFLS